MWSLFERVRTQWRVGFDGRVGLDYNPVIALVERAGAGERLWKILELLQVIEIEAMRKAEEAGGDG